MLEHIRIMFRPATNDPGCVHNDAQTFERGDSIRDRIAVLHVKGRIGEIGFIGWKHAKADGEHLFSSFGKTAGDRLTDAACRTGYKNARRRR